MVKLHVLTVATHCDGYFPALLQSCVLLGVHLVVLGWGERWQGFSWKLRLVCDYCRRIPPTDVVMFVDAFDCIVTQPAQVILERFLVFNSPFVCSSETCEAGILNSFSHRFHSSIFTNDPGKEWPEPLHVPKSDIGLKLLNSGTYICYAATCIDLMSKIPETESNDQRYLTSVYFAHPNKPIVLDTDCSLFHLWRCYRSIQLMSHEEALRYAAFRIPQRRGPKGGLVPVVDTHRLLEARSSIDAELPATEEATTRRMGESLPTVLKYAIVDRENQSLPCVIHIHCRRNVNWLMRKLGLPIAYYPAASYLWYAYYSLSSTLRTPSFRHVFISLVFSCVLCALFILVCLVGAFCTYNRHETMCESFMLNYFRGLATTCGLSFAVAGLSFLCNVYLRSYIYKLWGSKKA